MSIKVDQEIVNLSLLDRNGNIHRKSGLNWGQREKRDPNQAYIPVPRGVHARHPGFFPPTGIRFTIRTDDGQEFSAVMAQDYDKAIETPDDNSLLGKYFRRRIGVPLGEFVQKGDLERYGRTNVTIKKIADEIYLMDFSVRR